MATEPDIFEIKTTIATILKAAATLYDISDKTKLMEMEAGLPDWDGIPRQVPGGYVTDNPQQQFIENDAKVTTSRKHTVRFDVVLFVTADNARNAEEDLNDLVKIAIETLSDDDTLANGGTPRADTAMVERVSRFPSKKDKQPLLGAIITLKAIITTA